ncbi:FAD-binding oxidoreductase [Plantactinospora sp. WMMB782]|uniref:FAD-binding oxidoreductase n=1 Tax=Plantactinospora sp. WMMB782 TaxID=3404121 RepID=UPI003B93D392
MTLLRTQRLTGRVYRPGDEGFDERCAALHPAVLHRPVAVVEAAGVADVRAAVDAAAAGELPIAVQATGHGTHRGLDGGILLRTGGMTGVWVDPYRQTARVGPGTRWEHVLTAAARYGLAPLSGSSATVGVTGYTLGGGMGWLGRRYGLAADSVLRAELVLADGRSVTADADRHPELFWALRGGGGNFGLVTSLEFRLYPVSSVYAGFAYFPADDAAGFLARYRDWAAGAPDAMSTAVVLRTMPADDDVAPALRGRRVVLLKAVYAGEADIARRLLGPLYAAAGPVLHDGMRTVAYPEVRMGGTPARYHDFLRDLSDSAVEVLAGLRSTVEVRHWGGAIAAPGADPGPAGQRSAPFSVIVAEEVPGLAEALHPWTVGGAFLNFLGDTRRTATAYSAADHRRLRLVKAAYDPGNLFRAGHNIPPASSSQGGPRSPAHRAPWQCPSPDRHPTR